MIDHKADLTLTTSGEFEVCLAEAHSVRGEDFLDAYLPIGGADLLPVDIGRIVIRRSAMEGLAAEATKEGLTFEHITVP